MPKLTFPVNDSVFFYFLLCARCWLCSCGWITKLDGNIYLPHLSRNHQRSYAYIFAPFKSSFLWRIVSVPKSLQPTHFWNSLERNSWIFKRIFLSFSFFYVLGSDFAFPTSVSWYRWREDLTWSCKDFEIGKLWDVFNVECFNYK